MPDDFLGLPMRPAKPRERGWTHVIDKGLSLADAEGLIETAGDYVDVVKLGWGTATITGTLSEKVRLYQSAGIPVMAHIGFTPQSEHTIGGYRVQGRGDAAEEVLADARAVADAGAFAVVLMWGCRRPSSRDP